IWVAFHHEPENDAAIADWVAMQAHLAPIVHATSDDIAFSIVVTGWNQFYGPSEFSMANIWPGDGMVDVVGFDIYNAYGTPLNGGINTKITDFGEKYFGQIAAFAEAHDVAWGLAETGYSNEAYDVDPAWLARTYDQMAAAGGVAMTYFNTDLNSVASWPLAYGSKTAEFTSVLNRAPHLR
ncbi:MAG TPA: carbohydrate-binding protein CenC, partial [Actinotalea sp.]|nr:carbohydrate-binding protein CenC [Actinotalea sp.]